MQWRKADPDHDVEVLARLNKALIRDQGRPPTQTFPGWMSRATVFLEGSALATHFV